MVLSYAIQTTQIARAIGYALGFKDLVAGGRYLPQRVAVVTPIATAKVSGFTGYNTRHEITSLKELYALTGMCPGWLVTRILRPTAGGGLGTIPLDVFPIEDAGGATAAAGTITPSGTATANATHYVRFNGRDTIEGRQASFVVVSGDTAEVVAGKIATAIEGMLYAPVTAVDYDGTASTGSVALAAANCDSGDIITISDGVNTPIGFEAGGVGSYAFAVGDDAAATITNLNAQIVAAKAAGDLDITSVKSTTSIALTNDAAGVAGNVLITKSGTGAADWTIAGMAGGIDDIARVDLTARWKGTTGNEITVEVVTGDEDAGMTYAIVQPTDGAGTHATNFAAALLGIGEYWDTILVNCFGSETFEAITSFNGAPDVETGGTGRWNAGIVKPLVAISGSVLYDKTALKALMASRKEDLSNALGVAPKSPGYTFEVAANFAYLAATTFNNTPHRTCSGKSLPDMPDPLDTDDIGDMASNDVRDELVKAGCSTVTYTPSSGYVVEDFVTFRRPDDQDPLNVDFREVRSLVGIDFNVRYNYKLAVENNMIDKTLLPDDQVVDGAVAEGCIKPKQVKALIYDMADDLAALAIIADPQYTKDETEVEISSTNAKRIEAMFPYKRTSCAGIVATTAYAAFYYGE